VCPSCLFLGRLEQVCSSGVGIPPSAIGWAVESPLLAYQEELGTRQGGFLS